MDIILLLKAAIMGVVEGLTEFLPVSSTGHLILAGSLIDMAGQGFDENKLKAFEIIIQAGAILAVIWEYRIKISTLLGSLPDRTSTGASSRRFVLNVFIAFLPAAIVGLLLIKKIEALLFKPVPVALAFIIGALVIFWVERKGPQGRVARIVSIDDVMPLDALKIGLAQMFGLIPGTSRSGATIIGGMLFGLSRQVATEFSFFLAIPTLLGATAYSAWKSRDAFVAGDLAVFNVGLVVSFIAAFICVRWLLRYISTHDFRIFAWYRIVFGLVVLGTAYSGLIVWAK